MMDFVMIHLMTDIIFQKTSKDTWFTIPLLIYDRIAGCRRYCLMTCKPPNVIVFTQESIWTSGLQTLVRQLTRNKGGFRDFL